MSKELNNIDLKEILKKLVSIINSIIEMPCSNLTYILPIIIRFKKEIKNVSLGTIYLTESEYFEKIIEELENLKQNDIVNAVNILDARRFTHDPREDAYFSANIKAIKEKKITITRIFVIDEINEFNLNEKNKSILCSIKFNMDNGVNVKVVYKTQLTNRQNLFDDYVIFGESNSKLYLDYEDKIDSTRISHGELIINPNNIENYKKKFNTLLHMALSDESVLNMAKLLNNKSMTKLI